MPSIECQHCFLSVVRRSDERTHIRGKDLRRYDAWRDKPGEYARAPRNITSSGRLSPISSISAPMSASPNNATDPSRERVSTHVSNEHVPGVVVFENIYAARSADNDYVEDAFKNFESKMRE